MSRIAQLEATESVLKANIKSTYEEVMAIEAKYPDGLITSQDEREARNKKLAEVDAMESKLQEHMDEAARARRTTERMYELSQPDRGGEVRHANPDGVMSPGDQFALSPEYMQAKTRGDFNSKLNRLDINVNMKSGTRLLEWYAMARKALVYSGTGVAGAFVANDLRPGAVDLPQRDINVLDIIPRLSTDSDMIEYVREDTFTNNAAMTAEATATTGTSGLKPESVLAFSAQTAPVRTLAHWIPVTNRMLADAPAIRGIINNRLLLGLALKLEDQIIDGDGTGENFTGILRTAGINIQGKGTDSTQDAVFRGRTQVVVNGKSRPNAVIMHPNDWQDVRLARENAATGTLGGYLFGPPSQSGAVSMWGLPVIESLGMVENTALVGDFAMGATLFDREQAAIRVGLIDDQLVRNMQTILAELRAAFVVWRPTSFAKITGI